MWNSNRMTRRAALQSIGSGFGMVGLANLLARADAQTGAPAMKPAMKPWTIPARAKHVIFLFLNGGPSHVDTFDPKPMLTRYHGQPMPGGNPETERKTGNLMASPFRFKKHGQSGIEVSEIFSRVGALIDDFCVIRSMYTDIPNHPPALLMMNSGRNVLGHPSLGSWVTYGLGTENENLPGFIVLCPNEPTVGSQLWASAYLPGAHQGTHIDLVEESGDPERLIPFLKNSQLSRSEQRRQLDLLSRINKWHLERQGPAPELEASIHSMEVAFRMQTEALDAFDLRKEDESTRQQYGGGAFARGCLMARRLVERGVRAVQVYFGQGQPWDTHDDILRHRRLAQRADRPIAALLRDLKSRGLLDETLVLIGGEFGRTPSVEISARPMVQNGRDHNNYGFSMLLAGGGVKGGLAYGATDDFGFKAIENPVHVHDLHATILYLLGLDHTRLTYRYSGRDFRLTDVEGRVIREIIA